MIITTNVDTGMSYIKSKSSLLALPHRSVHADEDAISIPLLDEVKFSDDESEQIGGHDGSASKRHTLQASIHFFATYLILENKKTTLLRYNAHYSRYYTCTCVHA